jgi:hypothetical protein
VINNQGNLLGHATLGFGPPLVLRGAKGRAYVDEVERETGLKLTAYSAVQIVRPHRALALWDGPVNRSRLRRHFPLAFRRDRRSPIREWRAIQSDLQSLIGRGVLPARLPVWDADGGMSANEISYWPIQPDAPPTTVQPAGPLCGAYQLGTGGDDLLWCDEQEGELGYEALTFWAVAGGGRDVLIDRRFLSQLMSGGRGDDIIDADGGNDILYFGRKWGKDTVSTRCTGRDVPAYWGDAPTEPLHQSSSYVIFGRGVQPSDLRWISAQVLEHRTTGDRINFLNGPCYRFLAVEAGAIPRPPLSD